MIADAAVKIGEDEINTVFKIAYMRTGSKADADDITQQVFLKLLKSKKGFESKTHLNNYLVRAAINQTHTYKSSPWQKKTKGLEDYHTDGGIELKDDELSDAINLLSEKLRMVIHLYYGEGYKISEIANILKTNENTVKTRLDRAKKKLRKILKEDF